MSNSISKNFWPGNDRLSINFQDHAGAPSISMYEPPENAPTSRSMARAPGNPPLSKNFVESDKAARAADRTQGGQTHSVMRRGWK